ncbi:hypothetical protein BJ138DRAFT_104711 [Hygrophoropsis aurantiaca]|uniref:Uncharacterized protein n=1 Tax=Hygrophoropsis aurantiaca TaxID=72124 RepID=A0ACB8AAZ1_9AGAM|nr:hypothetical protein BJ138DRAFT_104711 [Hygrophoropsis aurantiaca]
MHPRLEKKDNLKSRFTLNLRIVKVGDKWHQSPGERLTAMSKKAQASNSCAVLDRKWFMGYNHSRRISTHTPQTTLTSRSPRVSQNDMTWIDRTNCVTWALGLNLGLMRHSAMQETMSVYPPVSLGCECDWHAVLDRSPMPSGTDRQRSQSPCGRALFYLYERLSPAVIWDPSLMCIIFDSRAGSHEREAHRDKLFSGGYVSSDFNSDI